jgi:LmbE family N-acetylglucosaminyl deacetylase
VAAPSAPAIVLSPHLDDAVLSCWSVLTNTDEVLVVNVFAGIPATPTPSRWDALCGARDAREHARKRIEEDREALSMVGRSSINLSFVDLPYRRDDAQPSLAALDDALARAVEATSVVYAPAAVGRIRRFGPTHPDHVLLRQYALGFPKSGIPVCLYADHPYCARHGWPAWISENPRRRWHWVDVGWRRQLARIPELTDPTAAEVKALTPDQATHKLRALERYETQFREMKEAYPGVFADPEIYGREVFWRIDPRESSP